MPMPSIKLLYCFLFAAVLSLTACGPNPVEQKYGELTQSIHNGEYALVYENLDQYSNKHFTQLVEAAKNNNPGIARKLGQQTGVPIMTYKLYDMLSGMQRDTPLVANPLASEDLLKLVLQIGETGIFRSSAEQPISLKQGDIFSENAARVEVVIPISRTEVFGDTYTFYLEDETWKLNFPSTLTFMETIHTQGMRRLQMNSFDYAKHLNDSSGDINFTYRRPRNL